MRQEYGYYPRYHCLNQARSLLPRWEPPPRRTNLRRSSGGCAGSRSAHRWGYRSHNWRRGNKIKIKITLRFVLDKHNCMSAHGSVQWEIIYFNRPWGKLVFTKGIAPCLFRTSTSTLSFWAGWSKLMITPQEQSWFLCCQMKTGKERSGVK